MGGRPKLILAPLATLTHAGFRRLVEELGGCDLYFNEMISASAYLSGATYEDYYTKTDPDPSRLVHQIVGSTIKELVACAEGLAADGVYGIDVNMGCSAPQIMRKGGGVAWMRDPKRAADLVAALRRALPETRLSAKLRLGEVDDETALRDFALGLQDAGLDWITLHPKLRKHGENRPAKWDRVASLVRALRIPVVGNGNVVDHASYVKRVDSAAPAGVMIGRGAAQKPWIFAELAAGSTGPARGRSGDGLAGGPSLDGLAGHGARPGEPAAVAERRDARTLRTVEMRFRELLAEHQPEAFWPTRAKRFYRYYSANFQFGYRLGAQIQNLRSYTEMTDHMDRYYDEHPDEAERPILS